MLCNAPAPQRPQEAWQNSLTNPLDVGTQCLCDDQLSSQWWKMAQSKQSHPPETQVDPSTVP